MKNVRSKWKRFCEIPFPIIITANLRVGQGNSVPPLHHLFYEPTRTPSAEVLRELSDSQYTVYDVLPAFFQHPDSMVTIGK
jgi:hypothetical protein